MSDRTIPQLVADIRANIAVLKMTRPPALRTVNVIQQLTLLADGVEKAYNAKQDGPRTSIEVGCASVAMDFGRAGVATVHHYEVRETVAGRCNLVATFTDPHRAAEYAERIAREDGNGND